MFAFRGEPGVIFHEVLELLWQPGEYLKKKKKKKKKRLVKMGNGKGKGNTSLPINIEIERF